jgi:hypothetical protein
MTKKRDWHRLNPSVEDCDIELDYNTFTVRARIKGKSWEYRKSVNVRHALSIGENICWEQSKR